MPIDQFSPKRAAVTKLLIASSDLREAGFHLRNALKRIEEAGQLAGKGSAVSLASLTLIVLAHGDTLPALLRSIRSRINSIAAIHYPEALTEES